jgi:hypothetical protein
MNFNRKVSRAAKKDAQRLAKRHARKEKLRQKLVAQQVVVTGTQAKSDGAAPLKAA